MKHRVRISSTVVVEAATMEEARSIASDIAPGGDIQTEYLGMAVEHVMSPNSIRHITKVEMRDC